MKKTVLVLMLVAVVAFAGGRGYGGFIVSYTMPDLSNLNSALTDYDPKLELESEFITYGGTGWGGDKLMLGGWGFGGSRKFDGDSISIRMSYGGGFFEPGYFINIWRGFGVKPGLGIGGTGISLELRPKLSDIEFDSLLANPARTSAIHYGAFTIAPSLSILIPIEFIAIEIKGGYMWSPFTGEWELEDKANLLDAPKINPSGVFASAGLLFGGGD